VATCASELADRNVPEYPFSVTVTRAELPFFILIDEPPPGSRTVTGDDDGTV
jgi:hypothetical protein